MEKNSVPTLPNTWSEVTIDHVGDIVTGNTPSKNNSSFYGSEFPFYKPTDLNNGYYVKDASDGLSSEGLKNARYIPEKCVLVTCIGATIGKVGFNRKPGATNQQINSIIPKLDVILPEYLYFLCSSSEIQRWIIKNSSFNVSETLSCQLLL